MNVAFVTPVQVTQDRTELSRRSGLWRQTLAALGSLTTIVIDVEAASIALDLPGTASDELGDVVSIATFELAHDTHPQRARRAPEYLGARWIHDLVTFDLIVGLSADIGLFCFGLASTGGIPVVLDLAVGTVPAGKSDDENTRYDALIGEVRRRCDLVANTAFVDGSVRIPDIERVQLLLDPPAGPVRVGGTVATETEHGMIVDTPDNGLSHDLDPVAATVYSLADGHTTAIDIIDVLATAFSTTPEQAIRRYYIALDQLIDARLVNDSLEFERVELPFNDRRFRVRPGSIDHFVAHHVHSGEEYEIPERLPTGTVAIDIGAHIGSFSARMIDSGAEFVVALEPQPDNFRMAMINLASEVERGLVDIRHAAIWSPPAGQSIVIGVAPTYPEPGQQPSVNTGAHRPRAFEHTAASVADGEFVVASQTLDDLITGLRNGPAPRGPIWLKLDCEGGEWPALETATRLDQLDTIVGELHLGPEASSARVDRVVERLESFGFRVTITDDPGSPLLLRFRAERR